MRQLGNGRTEPGTGEGWGPLNACPGLYEIPVTFTADDDPGCTPGTTGNGVARFVFGGPDLVDPNAPESIDFSGNGSETALFVRTIDDDCAVE